MEIPSDEVLLTMNKQELLYYFSMLNGIKTIQNNNFINFKFNFRVKHAAVQKIVEKWKIFRPNPIILSKDCEKTK